MLLISRSIRYLFISVAALILISTSCSSSSSNKSSQAIDEEIPSANAVTDSISEPQEEPSAEPITEPVAEPEPLPELEAKIIVTNIVSECSPEGDYCGFDIRLGSPPTENNEVSIIIKDVEQTSEVETSSSGCEGVTEGVDDSIATFNSGGVADWDVGRGFGLSIISDENLLTRTCTFTFVAIGATNYQSIEPFSYAFVINESVETDIAPPEPPVNVSCSSGGGSMEFFLEWDAPSDPDDVFGIYVYVSENGGAFNRILNTVIADGQVDKSIDAGAKWGVTVYPIPSGVPLMLAVTSFDESFNESGWWPIDAYFGSGLDCFTGPPPIPNIGIISPAGGSMETSIQILPNGSDPAPAEDISYYQVLVDTGTGFEEISISSQLNNAVTGGIDLIIYPLDHAPADYQITAVDYHGNMSIVASRSCPDPGLMECN